MSHERLLVLDFGSQYTQLIARRVRELNVYSEIFPFSASADEIKRLAPQGLILSGGPQSVYDEGAPQGDPKILELGIPVLGICYGMHWMCRALGGKVAASSKREYGHAEISPRRESAFLQGVADRVRVWMSHGDRVEALPEGFQSIASSDNSPFAAVENPDKKMVGIQFHPEVSHTPQGKPMLRNFLYEICGFRGGWTSARFIEDTVGAVRKKVGDGTVVCGLSGGVDSSVAATLIHRAVGDQLQCIFVDTGLLRLDEGDIVMKIFAEKLRLKAHRVDAGERFFALGRRVVTRVRDLFPSLVGDAHLVDRRWKRRLCPGDGSSALPGGNPSRSGLVRFGDLGPEDVGSFFGRFGLGHPLGDR